MTVALQEQVGLPAYEPTAEGLGAAIHDAAAQHVDAITPLSRERGDPQGLTGGQKLVLYPDASNPDVTIELVPIGLDRHTRQFPAGEGVHLIYNGKGAPGSGIYRVYNNDGKGQSVQPWQEQPEIPGTNDPVAAKTEMYKSLIRAITGASPERPAGRPRPWLHAMGSLVAATRVSFSRSI